MTLMQQTSTFFGKSTPILDGIPLFGLDCHLGCSLELLCVCAVVDGPGHGRHE